MAISGTQDARYRAVNVLERQDTANEHELRPLQDGTAGPIPEIAWTERGTVKKQYLTTLEAASLIVNKMIGTGIFTTPGLILALTQSKTLAFSFWVIGGVYAAICLFVYLDYATGLPFNGAELIWLTRIYHSAKLKLLPPILFASFFVLLYHTAGNALSFARYVIIAASNPGIDGSYRPNPDLVKAFAIFILAFVCFILWVSPRSGLVLSKTIALYKIALLIVLGSWGISARTPEAKSDWGWQDSDVVHSSVQRLSGFIYVAYAYNGWENSTYIVGQIDKSDFRWTKKIRWGSMLAVFLVSFSYSILTLGYYISCSYNDINTNIIESSDLGIARVFSNQVLHGSKGLAINIALSGFGNLIAVAYTQTKVKQAIALHHFLPFSTFLASDAPFSTPGGALLLHWLLSTVFILGTPTNSDGYTFIIGLVTFGQLIIATFVGLGRFKLNNAIRRAKLDTQGWKPWLQSRFINYAAGFVLAGVNIVLLVSASWPTPPLSKASKNSSQIPRYYWPVVLGSCLIGGILYWSVLKLLQGPFGRWIGWVWDVRQTKEESEFDQFRRLTRRDGTEERYHNTVKYGAAKLVQNAWKRFWQFLGDNL